MSYIVEIPLGGGESETVSAYPTGAYVQEKLIGGGYNGRFAKSGGRIVNSENKVIAEELDKSGVESNILLNYDNDQAVYYYFEWTDAGSNYSRRYQMMSVINYDGTENNVLGVWDAYGIGAPSELPIFRVSPEVLRAAQVRDRAETVTPVRPLRRADA